MNWLLGGFAGLGLFVGVVSGLSQTPIIATLLAIIITFAGGSIIAIVRGRDPGQLKVIGKSLIFFSIAALAGFFWGVILRQYGCPPLGPVIVPQPPPKPPPIPMP
ncbi:hypothetical protein ES703_102850 [subsurface metagenome]